ETTGVKLSFKERKQFLEVITWKNQDAEPVIKKVIKEAANPIYGLFNYKGKVVEFEQDSDLRDYEDVPILSGLTAFELAKKYFLRDVKP
ncbi:SAM-dependent DNA methyltransferase, partial [Pseudoalteromonas sp. SIMBA_148]